MSFVVGISYKMMMIETVLAHATLKTHQLSLWLCLEGQCNEGPKEDTCIMTEVLQG